MPVKWLGEPEAHDYDAAADYLSLIAEANVVSKTVQALKDADPIFRKAKDILRSARLVLLSESNVRVKGDLAKIADGYHRVCASYLTDENTPVPCRLASWQP